jgi:Ca2+-binding EF-hand superfamily protein
MRSTCVAALALCLGLTLSAAPGLAETTQKAVTAKKMDLNKDGEVSKKEFLKPWTDKKAGEEAFKRLDANGDGKITSADLMGQFQAMDKDKDGKVSLEEWSADWKDKKAAKRAFERLDKNQDGYLTPDEYQGMWPGIPFLTW